MNLNEFYCGDAVDIMKNFPAESVDLTVTSPPYDDLRNYEGYSFNAADMLREIYRITKTGGVCVWVVGDKIKNGSRTLSCFNHALTAKEIGFLMHDVMIYQKKNTPFMRSNAYTNCHEFMFVMSKGKPRVFNPIKEATVRSGVEKVVFNKGADAVNKKRNVELKKEKTKTNIWSYAVGMGGSTSYKKAFQHPAIFPEKLAEDHILSWSNEGDIILDPMCGSGTTCVMAEKNKRKWIGIDMSKKYIDVAIERINAESKNERP